MTNSGDQETAVALVLMQRGPNCSMVSCVLLWDFVLKYGIRASVSAWLVTCACTYID